MSGGWFSPPLLFSQMIVARWLLAAIVVSIPGIEGVSGRTAVAHIGSYPGNSESITAPGGTLIVQQVQGANMLKIDGLLTGLEAGLTGGWHIHTGYKCTLDQGEDANTAVGGHYFPAMPVDPWIAVKYTADAMGVAEIALQIKDFSLTGRNPVLGRAIVVHNADGKRVGCGVIQPTFGEVVHLNTYPGYSGTSRVKGPLVVSMEDSGSLTFKGTIAGLSMSASGGWHVHTGSSCSSTKAQSAYAVGGHYWPGMSTDPWNQITYQADASGVAQISAAVPGFSLYETNAVIGRAVVVHDPVAMNSERSGCGLVGTPNMGVVHLGAYPGHTGALLTAANAIGGTLQVTYDEPKQELHIHGLITGLQQSVYGGWHVHSGFTCNVDAGADADTIVGGHYWEGSTAQPPLPDPWNPMCTCLSYSQLPASVRSSSLQSSFHAAYCIPHLVFPLLLALHAKSFLCGHLLAL